MQIRPAHLDDAVWMAGRLRPEDVRELRDGTGRSPDTVLKLSLMYSRRCFTVLHEDRPVLLYGVAPCPVDARRGSVWLRATPEISRVAKSFLKEVPQILAAFHQEFPEGLYALADQRNTMHLRWLTVAGFMIHAAESPFILATHV